MTVTPGACPALPPEVALLPPSQGTVWVGRAPQPRCSRALSWAGPGPDTRQKGPAWGSHFRPLLPRPEGPLGEQDVRLIL